MPRQDRGVAYTPPPPQDGKLRDNPMLTGKTKLQAIVCCCWVLGVFYCWTRIKAGLHDFRGGWDSGDWLKLILSVLSGVGLIALTKSKLGRLFVLVVSVVVFVATLIFGAG